MAPSEHARRWRRWLLLCLAGVLGAAVVVMPALASSEGGPIEAGGGPPYYAWSPMSVEAKVGGTVSFSNSSGVYHGIEWRSPPSEPHCTAGVPVGTTSAASGTSWSGSCTFSKAGEYVFWCTVHRQYMSGKVIVKPNGETTTVTSTSTSTPTYPPPTTPGGGGGNPPTPGYETSAPTAGSAPALLAGNASSAVKVPASQHGHAVHGSVAISPAGDGASLEVDLFARSAGLASAGHSTLVPIGRFVVAHVHAGSVRFSVALTRKARKALARHRRLTVTLRLTLHSTGAKAITLTRTVLLRP